MTIPLVRLALPRKRPTAIASIVMTCIACALARPASARIEGEWYVLVHFENRAVAKGGDEQMSEVAKGGDQPGPDGVVDYRDFVWRFERDGAALRWTVFDGLGFRDDAGRTETIRGETARLRHAWWPSQRQLEEIRAGVAVDPSSARTKLLRERSPGRWVSGGVARAGSASAVSYAERWELDERGPLPLFELAATLASGRADSLEGNTRFVAERFDPETGRIEGRYRRDEGEIGRFTMWKQGVRARDDAAWAARAGDHPLLGPGGPARSDVAALEAALARARTPEGRDDAALRVDIRTRLTRLVEESYVRRGLALPPHRAEIDAWVDEIDRLCVVEGMPLEEVERRFGQEEPAS